MLADPPTSSPVITSNQSGDHLYQGDTVTLTCSVTGGKPPNATSVTFSCPNKPDEEDNMGSTGVSSSVTFNPLSDNDHNAVCRCSTRWRQTDWYNMVTSTTLYVNSMYKAFSSDSSAVYVNSMYKAFSSDSTALYVNSMYKAFSSDSTALYVNSMYKAFSSDSRNSQVRNVH